MDLPFRVEGALAGVLGGLPEAATVVDGDHGAPPRLRIVMARPASSDVALTVRVHSRQGIPLAYASASVSAGDRVFETTPVRVIAMDAYAHLSEKARHAVERRVWSRRAFATGSAA